MLPSWIPTRGAALLRGCRLQSGCDGRLAQGGRAREPLRLLCGSAPAVTAATPELVSHRTHPESPCRITDSVPPPHFSVFQPHEDSAVHRSPAPQPGALSFLSRVWRCTHGPRDPGSCFGDELECKVVVLASPIVSFCFPLTFLTFILVPVSGSVALLFQRAEFLQGGGLSILSLLLAGRLGKDKRLKVPWEG